MSYDTISGKIVDIDVPLRVNASRKLTVPRLLLTLIFSPVIAIVAISIFVAGVVVNVLRNIVFGQRAGISFSSNLGANFFALILFEWMFRKKKTTSRDYRVRDPLGTEYIVRVHGRLSDGNLSIGDHVDLSGALQSSRILLLHKGWNHTVASKISVARD